jgi:hypothetical protein
MAAAMSGGMNTFAQIARLAAVLSATALLAGCSSPFKGTQNKDCSSASDCDQGQVCVSISGESQKTCQIPCTDPTQNGEAQCPEQECTSFGVDGGAPFYCYPLPQ